MTLALAALACIFAALWWRALRSSRAWREACLAWVNAANEWKALAHDWEGLALKEQEARQRWEDYTRLWESIALAPLRPSALSGRVQ